jgi:hypothetical protein
MALLLLLPLLVSGYLVCLYDPIVYSKLHRYDGQLLYLQVGRFGITCLIMAFVIMLVLAGVFSHAWLDQVCIGTTPQLAFLPQPFCFPISTDFLAALGSVLQRLELVSSGLGAQCAVFGILTGLLTLMMPKLGALLTYRKLRKDLGTRKKKVIEAYILRESVSHSPIGIALVESFAFQLQVMITMDDRKVYRGFIQSVGAPTEVTGVDQEIEFLPSVSGYRDKDTMKVVYTTQYSEAEDVKIEPVYFRQENIVSISRFSEDIHKAFDKTDAGKDDKAEKFAENLDVFLEKLVKAIKAN